MLQICFCTSPILRIESFFETILGFLGITVMAVTLCYHCDISQVGNRIFFIILSRPLMKTLHESVFIKL